MAVMGYRVSHLVIGAVAAAPLGGWTASALAQNYTVQSIQMTGSAGTLASGPSNTTVTLSPSGTFSPSDYQRKPSALSYKVTIKCANHGGKNCSGSSQTFLVVMKDTSASATGRVEPLQNFTIGNNTVTVVGRSGSAPTTYTLSGLTNGATTTFQVGFDIPLLSSGTTGKAVTRTFSVGSGFSSVTSSLTSKMVATVWNPLAISVTSNLDFGEIVRPSSGSGTVTLTPSNGLSTSAGVLLGNTHSAAGFTVTGEGGQAFSVSVPPSFTITAPGSHTLTVTTTNSFSGTTKSLSGALGATGAFAFTVGGRLPISAGTASGAYVGNLIVTVHYN